MDENIINIIIQRIIKYCEKNNPLSQEPDEEEEYYDPGYYEDDEDYDDWEDDY